MGEREKKEESNKMGKFLSDSKRIKVILPFLARFILGT